MDRSTKEYAMTSILASLTIMAMPLSAQILGPYSTTTNFSIDLCGVPDTRPTTWGTADSARNEIRFTPPIGYQVRIMRVSGDFVYWPKSGTMAPGTSAEVGWGLKTTAPDGAMHVSNSYDNTMAWIQGAFLPGGPSTRIAFDVDTHIGGLLLPDNILVSQTFVAINTSGLVMHMEPTFTIIYRFEPIGYSESAAVRKVL